jgi:hypothetical protein
MKTTKKEEKVTERRDVLKLAAAGVVAGGVSAVAGVANAHVEMDTSGAGYKETQHVKTYYDTARF